MALELIFVSVGLILLVALSGYHATKSAVAQDALVDLTLRVQKLMPDNAKACWPHCLMLMRTVAESQPMSVELQQHLDACPNCQMFHGVAEQCWQDEGQRKFVLDRSLRAAYIELVWWYNDDPEQVFAARGKCRKRYDEAIAALAVLNTPLDAEVAAHLAECWSCRELLKALENPPSAETVRVGEVRHSPAIAT